jgi:hypothetical protein
MAKFGSGGTALYQNLAAVASGGGGGAGVHRISTGKRGGGGGTATRYNSRDFEESVQSTVLDITEIVKGPVTLFFGSQTGKAGFVTRNWLSSTGSVLGGDEVDVQIVDINGTTRYVKAYTTKA